MIYPFIYILFYTYYVKKCHLDTIRISRKMYEILLRYSYTWILLNNFSINSLYANRENSYELVYIGGLIYFYDLIYKIYFNNLKFNELIHHIITICGIYSLCSGIYPTDVGVDILNSLQLSDLLMVSSKVLAKKYVNYSNFFGFFAIFSWFYFRIYWYFTYIYEVILIFVSYCNLELKVENKTISNVTSVVYNIEQIIHSDEFYFNDLNNICSITSKKMGLYWFIFMGFLNIYYSIVIINYVNRKVIK